MIRRPPRSTPFPTRRSSDLHRPFVGIIASGRSQRKQQGKREPPVHGYEIIARRGRAHSARRGELLRRSEEHTSELQSRQYLVCRLLLEKKKNSNNSDTTTKD